MSVTTLPPVVYVPCERPAGDSDHLMVDVRGTADGRTALLVYSALDRLVACCGAQQPWVVVPTTDLDTLGTSFDLIFLDVRIPPEHQRTAEAKP
ncbi:MAG: SAV_915 family protein [Pseudonocardiaceae bacterium]